MKRILLYAVAVLSFCACDPSAYTDGGQLELPAIKDSDNIVSYSGYVSSYNTRTLIPDWVAYELTAEELQGKEERGDRGFSMDSNFHKKQARREDYRNSGWTKGHMAPAADFRWSPTAMDETFYFMNICPQNEKLNANDWEYLERKVRFWAKEYGSVWVVTGPIVGENIHGRIGDSHVTVPDAFFKAVLAWNGTSYQSIAFIMGNDEDRYYLRDCAISVNELENITGIDFFPALDDAVEDDIEDQIRLSAWDIR